MSKHFEDYLNRTTKEGIKPSVSDFVKQYINYIVKHSSPEEDIPSLWTTRFKNAANQLGIQTERAKADWTPVLLCMLNSLNMQSGPRNDQISASSPTTESKSSTSSSSSSCPPLTQAEYDAFTNAATKFEDERMWKLSTGTLVEKQLLRFGEQCKVEHTCHSWILDPTDVTYLDKDIFTASELQEIQEYRSVILPQFPQHLKEYMALYKGKHDLESLHQQQSSTSFHPTRDPDLYWIHQTIVKALELYHYKFFPLTDQTEADLLRRVWSFVETCFDESKFVVRCGEQASTASSQRLNAQRRIESMKGLARKNVGHKVDMLFKCFMQEYGAVECGVSSDGTNTKANKEGNIKLPKLLKDMFCLLVESSPAQQHHVRTVGFVISGLTITPIIMDCPEGYVTRLTRLPTYEFPLCEEVFVKQITRLITVVWQMRELLKDSLRCVQLDEESDDDVDGPQYNIPACLPSPKSKKRKISN